MMAAKKKAPKPRKLTAKQKRFIDEYLACGMNATQAAIRAGVEFKAWNEVYGFYVYALVDPVDGSIFYVGKGREKRYAVHFRRSNNPLVADRMVELHRAGLEARAFCLADGLTENEAFALESIHIESFASERLCNIAPGRLDPIERMRVEYQTIIKRIKPYREWVADKNPSEREKYLYLKIIKELAHECASPSPQWAVAENGKIVEIGF